MPPPEQDRAARPTSGAGPPTRLWLQPLQGAPGRRRQSALARQLLAWICRREGIALPVAELRLPGLALIDQFAARTQLGLSLAHCPHMLAVGLAPGKIGVDCETGGRTRNWEAIATQFFTADEADSITATQPERRKTEFLRLWVLKEACIKANRGGVFGDLNRLVVTGGSAVITGAPADARWRAWETTLDACAVALCTTAAGPLVTRVLPPSSAAPDEWFPEDRPGPEFRELAIARAGRGRGPAG